MLCHPHRTQGCRIAASLQQKCSHPLVVCSMAQGCSPLSCSAQVSRLPGQRHSCRHRRRRDGPRHGGRVLRHQRSHHAAQPGHAAGRDPQPRGHLHSDGTRVSLVCHVVHTAPHPVHSCLAILRVSLLHDCKICRTSLPHDCRLMERHAL